MITVSYNLGKCKTFDMRGVKDSDYLYTMYHVRAGDPIGRVVKTPTSKEVAQNGWDPQRKKWIKVSNTDGRRRYPIGHTSPWNGVGLRDYRQCTTMHQNDSPWGGVVYPQAVNDDFGRLYDFGKRGYEYHTRRPGWNQRLNGCKEWKEEGFDSQFVPDTWPNGPATLDLWPGTEERMIGDEYVVADGKRVQYVSHELV